MNSETMSAGAVAGILLLSVVIGGLMGYWAGRVAQRKGYAFWMGFLAGFAIGILGVLVMYLVPDRRKTQPPTRSEQPWGQGWSEPPGQPARTKACQRCGNLAEGTAEFCQYCGDRLPTPPG
ncbi:MAG: TIGR04086 family membrane protein [Actinobacteria bacterium]|nr:TIGR04086 family membrane protein [Actinomycetota bacterium]MBU1944490.1 TIGR04086 family membrane protein [Actinomycetota bacterium]MBU2688655.1 TIGR04086 family membrane protein [Actinomycetota bacterium]